MSSNFGVVPLDPSSCAECCLDLLSSLAAVDNLNPPLGSYVDPCDESCSAVAAGDFSNNCESFEGLFKLSCHIGMDFGLVGGTYLGELSNALICCEDEICGGKSTGAVPAPASFPDPSSAFEDSLCNSCCVSAQDFNEDFAVAFDASSCNQACESFERCFQNVDLSPTERLGCAIGYELRTSGETTLGFKADSNKVECVRGEIRLAPLNRGNTPKEKIPIYTWIGLIGMIIALLLLLSEVFRSRISDKESEPFQILPPVDDHNPMPSVNTEDMRTIIRKGTQHQGILEQRRPSQVSETSAEKNQRLQDQPIFGSSGDLRPPLLHEISNTNEPAKKEHFFSKHVFKFFQKSKRKETQPKVKMKRKPLRVDQFLNSRRALTANDSNRSLGIDRGSDGERQVSEVGPFDNAVNAVDEEDFLSLVEVSVHEEEDIEEDKFEDIEF